MLNLCCKQHFIRKAVCKLSMCEAAYFGIGEIDVEVTQDKVWVHFKNSVVDS